MSTLAAIALASGLVCALAPLAQAARIGATGSAHDVSLIWLSLYAAGSLVWVVYGAAIGSLPLIVSQATALASVGVVLVLAGRHRRFDGRSGETDHQGGEVMDRDRVRERRRARALHRSRAPRQRP